MVLPSPNARYRAPEERTWRDDTSWWSRGRAAPNVVRRVAGQDLVKRAPAQAEWRLDPYDGGVADQQGERMVDLELGDHCVCELDLVVAGAHRRSVAPQTDIAALLDLAVMDDQRRVEAERLRSLPPSLRPWLMAWDIRWQMACWIHQRPGASLAA